MVGGLGGAAGGAPGVAVAPPGCGGASVETWRISAPSPMPASGTVPASGAALSAYTAAWVAAAPPAPTVSGVATGAAAQLSEKTTYSARGR